MATEIADIMAPAKAQKMSAMWQQCEEDSAENLAAEAAEDAVIRRGMDEARRLYREDPEYRRRWDESAKRTVTLEEIMGAPSANGANGGAGREQPRRSRRGA